MGRVRVIVRLDSDLVKASRAHCVKERAHWPKFVGEAIAEKLHRFKVHKERDLAWKRFLKSRNQSAG